MNAAVAEETHGNTTIAGHEEWEEHPEKTAEGPLTPYSCTSIATNGSNGTGKKQKKQAS